MIFRVDQEPGLERWARPRQISFFLIHPKGMNARGPGAGSPEVPLNSRRWFRETGRFGVPATDFRVAVSLSWGN